MLKVVVWQFMVLVKLCVLKLNLKCSIDLTLKLGHYKTKQGVAWKMNVMFSNMHALFRYSHKGQICCMLS